MPTRSSFRSIENNKCNVNTGKDCMKRFCELLKEHTMKIVNIKKKNNSMNHMKIQKSILFVKTN